MLYQGVVQMTIICRILGHKAVALFLVQTALLVSLRLHWDFSNRFILNNSKTGILTLHKFSTFLLLGGFVVFTTWLSLTYSDFLFVSLLIDSFIIKRSPSLMTIFH